MDAALPNLKTHPEFFERLMTIDHTSDRQAINKKPTKPNPLFPIRTYKNTRGLYQSLEIMNPNTNNPIE